MKHPSPDHQNAIEEAVCSVETAAKDFRGGQGSDPRRRQEVAHCSRKATQGDRSDFYWDLQVSPWWRWCWHDDTSGGVVTPKFAESTLAAVASQINLLVDLVICLKKIVIAARRS
jgi:hypothetical protein